MYLTITGKVKRRTNEQLFIQSIYPLLLKILIHSKEAKINLKMEIITNKWPWNQHQRKQSSYPSIPQQPKNPKALP